MDDIKDITANESAFSIFEANVRTNPFGPNQPAHRVYRRVERVVAALYLITNHIPASEPIRVSIRSQCSMLLERAIDLRADMRADISAITDVKACIRHLIAMVRILTVARLLSVHNAQVVVDGLDDLSSFIDVSRTSPASEQVSVAKEDLLDIRRGPLMDIKDSHSIKDIGSIKDNTVRSVGSIKSGVSLGVREQHVLSVLTGAGELGIRDVMSSLPEYSEKMIQRELASLVAAGRVKKTGLKRWSRYSVSI